MRKHENGAIRSFLGAQKMLLMSFSSVEMGFTTPISQKGKRSKCKFDQEAHEFMSKPVYRVLGFSYTACSPYPAWQLCPSGNYSWGEGVSFMLRSGMGMSYSGLSIPMALARTLLPSFSEHILRCRIP